MSSTRPARARTLGVVVVLVAGLGFVPLRPVGADSTAIAPSPQANPSKVSGDIASVIDPVAMPPAVTGGLTAPAQPASLRVLVTPSGTTKAAAAVVIRVGGTVTGTSGVLVEATIPTSALDALTADTAVAYVRRAPEPLLQAITGEQTQASGASNWHSAGFSGAGVGVMVVDGGFGGLAQRQAEGELPVGIPVIDSCGGNTDVHGTAVAEIIHDMAPSASMRLYCVDSSLDLEDAVDDAIAHNVRIINASLGFITSSRGDGSGGDGTPNHAVARAFQAGILWVNAAGNYGDRHWTGNFTDTDGNTLNEFVPGDQSEGVLLPPGRTTFYLEWDEWPTASTDIDIYVFDANGILIGQSTGQQTGGQPPVESITVTNTTTGLVQASVSITRAAGTGTPRLDLWVPTAAQLEHVIPAGSVIEPGSSPFALAVGTYSASSVESYSSRGPTVDGRRKPDLAALDFVSTATYGVVSSACQTGGFAGTSASSPTVAGAAALLLELNRNLSVSSLMSALRSRTRDLGPVPGPDNDSGNGALSLGNPPGVTPPNPPPPLVVEPPPPPGTPPPPILQPTGYWMLGADGAVYAFGGAREFSSVVEDLAPARAFGVVAVDLEPTPSNGGYWIVDTAGRVYVRGDAVSFGDADPALLAPGERVVSLSATPAGRGYWLFTDRGHVLTLGDAGFFGDVGAVPLNGPVLDSIPTPTGDGYYMVASDGGIFSFGDAAFRGSMGNAVLNKPVQSLVPTPANGGYWLVASDGGIFAFGDAPFRGSMGSVVLNGPVTGMVRYDAGYLMVGEDGGIFNFSDAPFAGSLGANPPPEPIVSVAAS